MCCRSFQFFSGAVGKTPATQGPRFGAEMALRGVDQVVVNVFARDQSEMRAKLPETNHAT